jgi:type VII secretion-associated serine protease mycosin
MAAVLVGLFGTLGVAAPARADVRSLQWYLDPLHVADAQRITTGAGVIVAVIDGDGVDGSHPDLAGQVLPGAGFGGASANGWSTVADASHMTGVASVIAAKGGGPDHLLGIAPGAKILPVGVMAGPPDTTVLDPAALAEAIRWAVDHGAKVINMSIGSAGPAPEVERDAIRYALDRDVVLVAAAGNAHAAGQAVAAPANIPGVVAVAGVDRSINPWSDSSSGPEVAISAPAVGIPTATPRAFSRSGYASGDGTSFAAPIVTGTVALIRAKYPQLNAANVIERLIATAKDQDPPGRDEHYGFGTVRVVDALTKDVPTVSTNPLGTPDASPSPGADTGPPVSSSRANKARAALIVVGVLVALVVLVVVLVVVGRSRRKSRAAG